MARGWGWGRSGTAAPRLPLPAGRRAPATRPAQGRSLTHTHARTRGRRAGSLPRSELRDVHRRRGEGPGPEAPQVAAAAQQVAVQGVAAASILPAQLQPAVLGKNTAPTPE